MTLLALIRHGPTEWNETGVVQGRSDIPLSDSGRALVATWQQPEEIADFEWVSSPLKRAVETAKILSGRAAAIDDRLVEMDWSEWEGMRLPDLRAQLGNLMKAWEAKGLDFRAPGGESPRDVQDRLRPFLAERAAASRATAVVCHKGVIRALYALAVSWDMTDKAPDKLHDDCTHLFELAADGTPQPYRLNVPLTVQDE
ncbi:MAG: histidine phosphatase family protein [Alphaproteobacteria bacterium]|nr:histidine phosphatase family protein [Alphaproteobacteria bacterium]